jgi:hypothetical protein
MALRLSPRLEREEQTVSKRAISIAVLVCGVVSFSAWADQSVRGYTRKDGTYVAPHYRSDANQHRYDNYGSKGNYNPYTGEKGYGRHEYTNPPAYNQPRSGSGSKRSY